MSYIEPLSLQTWFMSVFAGTPEIFTALALLFISGMCGYFRMTTLSMFFILGVFLLMFSGFIEPTLLILIAVIGGLLIGLSLSKLLNRIP